MTIQELKNKANFLEDSGTFENKICSICNTDLNAINTINDFDVIQNYEFEDAENIGQIFELEDGYVATIENSIQDYVKFDKDITTLQKWLTDEIYELNQNDDAENFRNQ